MQIPHTSLMRNFCKIFFPFGLVILLASCSTPTKVNQQAPSKLDSISQPIPTCSASENSEGSAWISGQLEAFGESKPDKAYSYASETFRVRSSVEDFASIITSQYTMVLNLKEYRILSCDKDGQLFTFAVKLIDNENLVYDMEYLLTLSDNKWGVEAASVSLRS